MREQPLSTLAFPKRDFSEFENYDRFFVGLEK